MKYFNYGRLGRLFVLFALVCAISSCGPLPWTNRAKAREQVRSQLYDPVSAQFRNEETSSLGAVCGEVNAKNRMGGYVGFSRYIYMNDSKNAFLSGEPDFKEYYRDLGNEFSRKDAGDKILLACTFETLWATLCPEDMKGMGANGNRQCKMWRDGGAGEAKLKEEVGVD